MPPQEPEKLSPITHRQLLEFMQALGYDVETGGMCYGFTHVAIMAALLGQLEVYTRRLRLINRIYHENLHLITSKNISAEEKRQRLEELLKTVYAAKNEERNEHSTKTDVLAFFDAVVVYQRPSDNRHLFPRDMVVPVQSFKDSFPLVGPTAFDGKRKAGIEDPEGIKGGEEDDFALGPVVVKRHVCGVYHRKHLERYFGELEKKIQRLNLKGSVCLRMENENHTFVVSYSSRKKKWTLIDSGEPTDYTDRELTRLSPAVLAKFGKQRDESVALASILYTTFDDGKHIRELFAGYENNPGIHAKPIQDLTPDEQFQLLYFAVDIYNLFLINALLEKFKVDVNQAGADGLTPLMRACQGDHLDVVRALMNAGALVDKAKNNGFTPLMMACQRGHLGVVEALLKAGAIVNQCDHAGFSPLMMACQRGHLGVVEALLKAGARVNQCDRAGFSPLMIACQEGHLGIVMALIRVSARAIVNQFDHAGFSPLMMACQRGHLGVVEALLKAGARVNQCGHAGFSPLMIACQEGHLGIVMALIRVSARAIVNQCDHAGFSPLMMACQEGHLGIVKALLKARARVNQCDHDGFSPLMLACQYGYLGIVEALIRARADFNQAKRGSGSSPLMMACQQGHLGVVKVLIRSGANLNQAKDNGFTSLNVACKKGQKAIVAFLLASNANHTLSAKVSIQVLRSRAKKQGRERQFQAWLKLHKGLIKKKTVLEFSPLANAVFMGHEAIVKLLLDKIKRTELNKSPICLIELAKAMGHVSIARLLTAKTRLQPNEAHNQALANSDNDDALCHHIRKLLDTLNAEFEKRCSKKNIRGDGNVDECESEFEKLTQLLLRAKGQKNKYLVSYRLVESVRVRSALEAVCQMKVDNNTQVMHLFRAFRRLQGAKQGGSRRRVRKSTTRHAPAPVVRCA